MNDLANRARLGKLLPDEVSGGTYTVTNVGTFGNVLGTPVINQPQVAIMATGAIRKKPAVIETPQGDLIGIRHQMFLSHSYDHRVVDGALGGRFVRRVADILEAWSPDHELLNNHLRSNGKVLHLAALQRLSHRKRSVMKYGYAAISLLFLASLHAPVFAQGDNTSFNWKFEEGNKLMEEKFYNQAADIWDELLATDPENANLNYKLGYSYFNSYNQKSKALPYLEKASAMRTRGMGGFNTAGYDPFDARNATHRWKWTTIWDAPIM